MAGKVTNLITDSKDNKEGACIITWDCRQGVGEPSQYITPGNRKFSLLGEPRGFQGAPMVD